MEQWTRWEPIQGLEGKYYLESFTWKEEGFFIELEPIPKFIND